MITLPTAPLFKPGVFGGIFSYVIHPVHVRRHHGTQNDSFGVPKIGDQSSVHIGRKHIRHKFTHSIAAEVLKDADGVLTPRTPVDASGRQGVREAEPNEGFGNSTTLGPLVRSDPRGLSCLRPYFCIGSHYKKIALRWCFRRRADRARKKKALTTAPARGGGRGSMSVGARRVLQA